MVCYNSAERKGNIFDIADKGRLNKYRELKATVWMVNTTWIVVFIAQENKSLCNKVLTLSRE